jgi:hypothetical protein
MEYSVALAGPGDKPDPLAAEKFVSSVRAGQAVTIPTSLLKFIEVPLPPGDFRALERSQGASLRFGEAGARYYLRQREQRLLLVGQLADRIEVGEWWLLTAEP